MRFTALRVASAALLLVGATAPNVLHAQKNLDGGGVEAVTSSRRAARRVIPALRLGADTEVSVDGRIDEAAWADAQLLSGFVQGEPVEGIQAEYDTEVRVLFGDDAIYVAARMW